MQTVRREFVANVSHELRTPLGGIRIYAETLLDGGLEVPGMAEDSLNKIIDRVDLLTQLVNELLDLSRLESGRVQPKLVPLDLADLASDAVDRMEPQAERADVTLRVAVPPGVPPVVGDRQMLEGALVNLIHNAVKFTPSGGAITVGATAAADGAVALGCGTRVSVSRQNTCPGSLSGSTKKTVHVRGVARGWASPSSSMSRLRTVVRCRWKARSGVARTSRSHRSSPAHGIAGRVQLTGAFGRGTSVAAHCDVRSPR